MASALLASVGHDFRNERQVAAWIGLTPGQYSSGGKARLGSITKAGDAYLSGLVNGARAVIARFCSHSQQRSEGTGKCREGKVIGGEFVVASGDAPKMFDAIEEALDDVPGSIQHTAIETLGLSIRVQRNTA